MSEFTEEEWQDFQKFFEDRRKESDALYAKLETRLGIPEGFISALTNEADDWAFIVKLAVLCEAAVTQALVAKTAAIGHEEVWYDHFSNLTNGRRLELAFNLDILSQWDRDKLNALAQFRNSFAHQVHNLGGSLSKFFENCSLDKKVELASKLLSIKHTKDQDWSFYIANARFFVHLGALTPLKNIAKFGLDSAKAAEIEKDWALGIFVQEPAGDQAKGGAEKP